MIAWYVHHHGTGHLHRATSIAAALRVPVLGLSSRPRPPDWDGEWVHLDEDASGVDPETADVTAGATLHWVPRGHAGLRRRMGAIGAVLASGRVTRLVCDVSVEVAVLARLHGVPVVVMAQPGDRTDRAHRLAYDLADLLVAPWPSRPAIGWDPSWSAKAVHVGGFSRYDRRPVTASSPDPASDRRRVLVLWGSGGVDVSRAALWAAAAATPTWRWQVAGPEPEGTPPSNLEELGWVDDLWPMICSADVVVTHAGQNAVAEVAAARRPAVVIPQVRPYGEQQATADAIESSRIATVIPLWPGAERWVQLLDDAATRTGTGWSQWSSGDGAVRAARAIEARLG